MNPFHLADDLTAHHAAPTPAQNPCHLADDLTAHHAAPTPAQTLALQVLLWT